MSRYTYPDWLQVTGKPVFWAYKLVNGPRFVSKSVVKCHLKGRVYLLGSCYGFWANPAHIEQVYDKKKGAQLDD